MEKITSITPVSTTLTELGERLAAVRKQRGLSQTTLAEQAGLGVATLRRIEGGSDSQLESWIKLLAVLDLSAGIDSLLPQNQRSPMAEAQAVKKKRRKRTSNRWGDEAQ